MNGIFVFDQNIPIIAQLMPNKLSQNVANFWLTHVEDK